MYLFVKVKQVLLLKCTDTTINIRSKHLRTTTFPVSQVQVEGSDIGLFQSFRMDREGSYVSVVTPVDGGHKCSDPRCLSDGGKREWYDPIMSESHWDRSGQGGYRFTTFVDLFDRSPGPRREDVRTVGPGSRGTSPPRVHHRSSGQRRRRPRRCLCHRGFGGHRPGKCVYRGSPAIFCLLLRPVSRRTRPDVRTLKRSTPPAHSFVDERPKV